VNQEASRRTRALAVIAAVVVVIAAVGLVYLRGGITSRYTGAVAGTPTPSVESTATPWNGSCASTQMKFTGIFNECATVDKGTSCPSGSFNQARVVRMHGTKDDFILYIEVNGNYHGPGTYVLEPWPHDSLGLPDGVAKVAVREYVTGRLRESSAGSLTIDNLENGGFVYAGLGPSVNSSVVVELNIAGWWSCS
jgi:hypothetical protein